MTMIEGKTKLCRKNVHVLAYTFTTESMISANLTSIVRHEQCNYDYKQY